MRDGDDWVINGSKIFISGADGADFGIVFARTDAAAGRGGITCFIVDGDTPGFHVRRVVHTLRSGHYGTELQFEDARVPHENVLGEVNRGFAIANDRLTRQRIPYAAGCLGVADPRPGDGDRVRQAARDLRGRRSPPARRSSGWWSTTRSTSAPPAGRSWRRPARRRPVEPFRTEAAMAKLLASEGASRVVDRAIQIHGGYGVTKDLPLERWYREMRIRRIGEGPSEVQRIVMARDLFDQALY